MPRAPSQKSINASANAAHPYAVASPIGPAAIPPTSSASAVHLPQSHQRMQQHHQKDLQVRPYMNSLYVPSSNIVLQQLNRRHRDENAGPSSNLASPHDSPRTQVQAINSSDRNQGSQKQNAGKEGSVYATKEEVSPSMEPMQPQGNGNASPTGPAVSSGSSGSATPANASGPPSASAGSAQKKKHVCSTCDRAFTTSGHLARHARVHTGERNHKCPFPGCETRCSRQDNLQQHYRIHLSPGSRRSSSSATRAAIQRAISNPSATSPIAVNSAMPMSAMDLDTPPPLAQATLPPPSLAQTQFPYQSTHQPYPASHASPLSQSHVPSPHTSQTAFPPQTPPVPNVNGHLYENGNGAGVATDVPQRYGHAQPESPGNRSAPASATPSADASPVIGGPGSVPAGPPPYTGQASPYLYVQQTGYYQPQHTGPGSAAPYAPPAPAPPSGSNAHYPPPPISTFYQQHHYPQEAYMNSALPPSTAPPQTQTPPGYPAQHPLPQQTHEERYVEEPRRKTKRRARSSADSITNGELSPSDSPVIANVHGHSTARANGQGQSNVYAFYGMSTPPSSSTAPAPTSSGSAVSAAPPPSPSSHANGRYSVNGNANGFNQFQVHTPPPPPLTTSSSTSGMTNSSNVSYPSNHAQYASQSVDANGSANGNGNGTHSPPPVLAPIQMKRLSFHDTLPSRYSYGQHPNHSNNSYEANIAYASAGKGYSE